MTELAAEAETLKAILACAKSKAEEIKAMTGQRRRHWVDVSLIIDELNTALKDCERLLKEMR